METKNTLPVTSSGYMGLQQSQRGLQSILRSMCNNTPIRYTIQQSETTTITTYQGNGIKTTIIVEKGGRP